jgi:indolepyruvate ferredoxin oxidoreductase
MTMVDPGRAGFTLDDRYLAEEGTVYLTGIQALVRMLIDRARYDAGLGRTPATLVSGYEGSPLAGYDLEIQRRLPLLSPHGVVFRPGLNEELAATTLGGTQLAGEVATLKPLQPGAAAPQGISGVWYGKAAGLDRASDAVRHANLIGTSPHGGVVALVGDDPAMKSSSCPSSSEPMIADLQLPGLYPADSHEALEFYLHAVEMSRASGLWTSMKIAVNMADGASTAVVPSSWIAPDLSDLPAAYAHRPHARLLGADQWALERTLMHDRQDVALEYVRRSGVNTIHGPRDDARIGIVAAGKSWLDLRQSLTALGITDDDLRRYGIRLLKMGAIFPVEPTVVREFARGLTEIVVVEDKRGYLETAIRTILYGTPDTPDVHGKYGPSGRRLFSAAGELDPDVIARALAARLLDHAPIESVLSWQASRRERVMLPLAPRTPYFCSGCPHNSSTKAPDGSLVGGGIGCHSMVMMLPDEQRGDVTGLCQMGGEGAQWLGMAPFVETPHLIQNLGDGTFAHSGSLAVRAAAAAGVNVTYKILYNATVAMTGGQDAVGGMSLAQMVGILALEGAKKIVVTTEEPGRVRKELRRINGPIQVRHRDDLVKAQEELAQIKGLTVLVHDQACAAEKRRKRKRGTLPTPVEKVVINERICEGCGDCGEKSNCLSVRPVATELGRKTQIHQSSCNLDYSCLKGDCPSFLTVVPGGRSVGPPPPPPPARAPPRPRR